MNWETFARLHPDAARDVEPDRDGRHGIIQAAGGAAFISIGKGPSMILAALHDSLSGGGDRPDGDGPP